MRSAIYALGLICVACGGEARRAAPPSAPSQSETSAAPSVIEVAGETDAPEPPAPPAPAEAPTPAPTDYAGEGWSAEQCRGKSLDLEAIHQASSCAAKPSPDMPPASGVELRAPAAGIIPYGNETDVQAVVVNTLAKRVGLVVTLGDGLPAMSFSKLRRGGKEVEGACSFGVLTLAHSFYIELEPSGELTVEGTLYPNDTLQEEYDGADCSPKLLPRGNEYQAQLSVSVNRDQLTADWTFKIK
ncbi:MAG: hypothetical protein R3B07_10755 [Polyangiaceae bacterium]